MCYSFALTLAMKGLVYNKVEPANSVSGAFKFCIGLVQKGRIIPVQLPLGDKSCTRSFFCTVQNQNTIHTQWLCLHKTHPNIPDFVSK